VNVVKLLAPSVDFAKMNFMTGTTATVRAFSLCLFLNAVVLSPCLFPRSIVRFEAPMLGSM
jgi:hypothetical protein